MKMTVEVNSFGELYSKSWSGALDTLDDVLRAHKGEELMALLEDIFSCGDMPTATEVNDFLWFERDYIYESLGLDENGEIPTDEDDEDEEEEE